MEPSELEESDVTEDYDFPPRERKIITQPYDLSLQTLKEQWAQKTLVIPPMQREYVWDNGRASRLIESLLLNIPVPPIYFAERSDAVFEIVDGHQRVRSIVRYLDNHFALTGVRILTEYTRTKYHQLPDKERRFLMTRSLRAVVIGSESHPNMKFETFERLNTGGIALNPQELRNSLYRGSLNDLLRRLARECNAFRNAIGTPKPRRRMVDEELVLRWLAFRDCLASYRPPLKRFLNEYMQRNQRANEDWLQQRAAHFEQTMRRLNEILGTQAFRLIDEDGNRLRDERGKAVPGGVNRALFDAQGTAFSWIDDPQLSDRRRQVVKEISRELTRVDLQDAVRRATGDRTRIRLRISRIARALRSGGVHVDVPEHLEL
ncbi:DUF262 domain-containing protein [Candidatus Palauibacter sp.]|uniref:DUF262 domain-containing protein n=1 Tax=Candidatus Palauibacter sp. TaxID=3101350 RepID=UPI003B53035B